jgi:hypothetical protein
MVSKRNERPEAIKTKRGELTREPKRPDDRVRKQKSSHDRGEVKR